MTDSRVSGPSMRAARFARHGGPEVIRVEDVPIPEPGEGEVRIRVEASALNHLDLWVRRGLPIEITMPHIGGSDIAGRVDAIGGGGASVTALDGGTVPLAEGDRVVVDPSLGWVDPASDPSGWGERSPVGLRLLGEHVDGGFAQFVVVPAANVVPIPEALDFNTAAAASLAGVTAWRALVTRGRARRGERVLVTGASGGVSTMAIQFAAARGAEVIAVTSTPWVESVAGLGAEVVIDRAAGDWVAAVKAAAPGGVHVVVDSVGAPMWGGIVRLLAPGGRVVSYGATGGHRVEIDLRHHFWKQTEFLGSTMGSPEDYRRAMSSVARGEVRPPIHATLPLSRCAAAHELLEGGGVFGKVVLNPWAEEA